MRHRSGPQQVVGRWPGQRRRAVRGVLVVVAALAATLALPVAPAATAAALPAGFQESVVFSGLAQPTAVRFSRDGRIFVAEKRGVIKVFDSLTDTTPDVFADLNVNVYNFWDRGRARRYQLSRCRGVDNLGGRCSPSLARRCLPPPAPAAPNALGPARPCPGKRSIPWGAVRVASAASAIAKYP